MSKQMQKTKSNAIITFYVILATIVSFLTPSQAQMTSPTNHKLIDLNQPLPLTFSKSEQVKIKLLLSEGSLINLALSTEAGAFDVDLIDESGQHIRRFLNKGEGRKHVVFVAPSSDTNLIVKANAAGSITITQTGRIDKHQLKNPPQKYLSPRLQALSDALQTGGNIKTLSEDFWQQVKSEGTPIIERDEKAGTILTFLARGAKSNVKLLGGPNNDHYALERLGESDIWYRSQSVPDGTLFSYQLAKDVPDFDGPARQRRVAILATAKADPLNQHPWPQKAKDSFNQRSTFRMEKGALPIWHEDQGNKKGSISHHRIKSEKLGNQRDVWLYRSPGFDATNADTPLLIVFDGERFRSEGQLETSLDNMVAKGTIPPLAALFISPIDLRLRASELPDSNDFASFVAKDLMAFILEQTGLSPKPNRTILAGASFGGLGSTTIALKHPDIFGNVLSLSGSYWWSPTSSSGENYVARKVLESERKPVRFFLSAGIFETPRNGDFASIAGPNRHLRDVLLAKGYQVTHKEYPAAHDMFAWREILPEGLIALLGN